VTAHVTIQGALAPKIDLSAFGTAAVSTERTETDPIDEDSWRSVFKQTARAARPRARMEHVDDAGPGRVERPRPRARAPGKLRTKAPKKLRKDDDDEEWTL